MVNSCAVCGCCTRTDIVREHLEDTLRICDVSAKGLFIIVLSACLRNIQNILLLTSFTILIFRWCFVQSGGRRQFLESIFNMANFLCIRYLDLQSQLAAFDISRA